MTLTHSHTFDINRKIKQRERDIARNHTFLSVILSERKTAAAAAAIDF
jgi:hypothetical protein